MAKPLEGKTVIVIEDDVEFRETLEYMLQRSGAEVIVHGSHQGSLQFPKADVILTDNDTNRAPGGAQDAGLEYLRGLRAFNSVDPNRNTPALLMTGNFKAATAAVAEGFSVIEKPFELKTIADVLLKAIDEARDRPRTS